MDINEELDLKFRDLDDKSKLVVAFATFSQCACSHRRFVGLGQLKHAHDYILSDAALSTAEDVGPEVAALVNSIRDNVNEIAAAPPEYVTSDLSPNGDAPRHRDFLWEDAFEEPIWFDIRHSARKGLVTAEDHYFKATTAS